MVIAAAASAACGNDGGGTTPTAVASSKIAMVNETPCVLHFRFDNGIPKGRVQPGTTQVYDDPLVAAARFVKFESTRAVFRTFDMEAIRADGDRIVVRTAVEDGTCVETGAE